MAGKTDGRDAKRRRNEGFFTKNGRKQGVFPAKFFEIAFVRRLMYCSMVVYAGCNPCRYLNKALRAAV